MKQRRLALLLVIMVATIAARVWTWPSSAAPEVVGAVARPASSARDTTTQPILAPTTARSTLLAEAAATTGDDALGDPFAVHRPPQPVAAVAAPPVVEPSVVAPEPEPPYQVIGTFDGPDAPGVIVSTPHGVEIVHVGTVLDAEFKVIAMNAKSLTIEQVSSKRHHTINMPAGESP